APGGQRRGRPISRKPRDDMKRRAPTLIFLALLAGCLPQSRPVADSGTAKTVYFIPPSPSPSDSGRKDTAAKPKTPTPASARPASEAETAPGVVGNPAFALALYANPRGQEGNLFFPPWSISSALAMTRAGARGATGGEMEKVLHFTLPADRQH